MTLEIVIARYGVLGVLVGAGLEGEAVVVTAGLLAHRGLLPLPEVMAAASAGSLIADQTYFALGRHFREHRFVRKLVARPAFARALATLERHPTGFVLAFRFLYGLRTVSPLAIGSSSIAASRFVFLNGCAAAIWGISFAGAGYLFGQGIVHLFGRFHSTERLLIMNAAAAVLLYVGSRLIHRAWLKSRGA